MDNLNVESEETPGSIGGAWVFCLFYCAFSFGMFYFAVTTWRELVPILITGFFAVFGVLYLAGTIWQTLGQGKFGAVRLLLERPAPSIGGTLRASVAVPPAAMRAPTLVAELTCEKEIFGGKDNSSTTTLWCGKRSFPLRRKPDGGAASIAIDIPTEFDVAATTPRPTTVTWSSGEPPKVFYSWKLKVTVDLPGVDLSRNYPIVVLPLQPGAVRAAAPMAEASKETGAEIRKGSRVEALSPLQAAALAAAAATPAPARAAKPLVEEGGEVPAPDRSSIGVLVAANLVAVAGALFWGWAVEDIVFLYWIENLVIGAFNIPRILLWQPDQTENLKRGIGLSGGEALAGKAMLAAFFLVHYGAFCFGHGEFLVGMFPGHHHGHGLFETVGAVLREKGMLLAVLAIIVSRGYSFFRNFVGRREYEGMDVRDLMMRPYKRIFVTHIFIIAGGFVLSIAKLPALALVVFIAIKIAADVYYHRAERDALGAAPATA